MVLLSAINLQDISVRATNRHKDPNMMGLSTPCLGCLSCSSFDEETSGLMLIATNEKTQLHLKEQLERREVQRRYWAIASGHLSKALRVDNIHRNRGDGKRGTIKGAHKSDRSGQRAISHFKPMENMVQP